MKPTDLPVVVLAKSPRWQSAIEREFKTFKLVWALDESDLLVEAIAHPNSAVILELSSNTAIPPTDLASEPSTHWWSLVLDLRRHVWLLTNYQQSRDAARLRFLGIVEVFVATAETHRLKKMLYRHNCSAPQSVLSLEEQIESKLPWR